MCKWCIHCVEYMGEQLVKAWSNRQSHFGPRSTPAVPLIQANTHCTFTSHRKRGQTSASAYCRHETSRFENNDFERKKTCLLLCFASGEIVTLAQGEGDTIWPCFVCLICQKNPKTGSFGFDACDASSQSRKLPWVCHQCDFDRLRDYGLIIGD